jgi:hypothetical protein
VGSSKSRKLIFTFSNSGVVQTYTRNPGLIAGLSPNRDKFPPTFSSSRIVQSRTSGFELMADGLSEPAPWMNNLKADLEMPGDALLRHLTITGAAFSPRWQNYNLRFLGIVVKQPAQAECSWPFWRVSDTNGNEIEQVQIWFQRVSCLTSPVYGDVRWHPAHGETAALTNVENSRGMRDVRAAVRGLTLLKKINIQGRPVDSGNLTKDQFVELAPLACRKLLDVSGEMPSGVDIAAELFISKATFYRYMRRDDLTLNKIRDKAKRLRVEQPTPF